MGKTRTVSKGVLKAKMLAYFRELEEQGGELVVTDYGKPVLKIAPYQDRAKLSELFKDIRGKATIPREAALESSEDEWDV